MAQLDAIMMYNLIIQSLYCLLWGLWSQQVRDFYIETKLYQYIINTLHYILTVKMVIMVILVKDWNTPNSLKSLCLAS